MYRRVDADTLEPHGILMLEIEGDAIAALDAFIDPALPGAFARPAPA